MEPGVNAYPKLLVRPVVVITTVSDNGIPNAAPFSFNSPISFDPPLYLSLIHISEPTRPY